LSIDQGLIHPMTVLKDAPSAFGAFSPENFDGRFVGPINATQALIRSRNVPAVWLASQLSNPSLHQFLKSAGISKLRSERHYGLALALGGSEVTAEELGTLYAMLANRGRLESLRYLVSDARNEGPALLSADASFMVLDMLRQSPRPDDTPTSVRAPVSVAWKTGTSWGFRDAWTAGAFGPYVLVVWVGNFDGSSNPGFIGVQAAAPLFFRLFDALVLREPALHELRHDTPARLQKVAVCAASGDLPNAACPKTVSTWYLPGVSPIKLSTIHRRVAIDTRTGRVACPPFDARHMRTEVFEYWPSDLAQLFTQAGMPRRQAPENPCAEQDTALRDNAPAITSPLSGTIYTLRRSGQSVPLAANLSADSRRVYWFVNSSYVGAGDAGIAVAWTPTQSGRYTVLAVDDQGRNSSRELNVEWLQ
jgi:penicillin-binding protein 1C